MKSRLVLLLLAIVGIAGTSVRAHEKVENVVLASSYVQRGVGFRPAVPHQFPRIRNWKTLTMSLQRYGCLGDCPVYKVEIRGDGSVLYDGVINVVVSGRHRGKISPKAVRALFEAFRRADFFGLRDEYLPGKPGFVTARPTDAPSFVTSISFDGQTKIVSETMGLEGDMPGALKVLEDAVDEAAQTAKWVQGDDSTISRLKAEAWDFRLHMRKQALLLVRASRLGNPRLVQALLEEGVPARGPLGCAAVYGAAERGDVVTVKRLIVAGAPVDVGPVDAEEFYHIDCRVLRVAAERGSPEIVALVLGLHPDVNARDARGGTALIAAAECGRDQGCAQVVQMLIAAGAVADAQNDEGRSALMLAGSNSSSTRALLAAGATVDARDWRGGTALMWSFDLEVTRLLLEAGANPYLKDKDGKTALDEADDWRKTGPVLKAWMAAHPPK